MSCEKAENIEPKLDYSSFEGQLNEGDLDGLVEIIGNNQIPNEDYINWRYTFQTRNEKGEDVIYQLDQAIYARADSDEKYLKKVAVFYSGWPQEVLQNMKEKEGHPGATKIANSALHLISPD